MCNNPVLFLQLYDSVVNLIYSNMSVWQVTVQLKLEQFPKGILQKTKNNKDVSFEKNTDVLSATYRDYNKTV